MLDARRILGCALLLAGGWLGYRLFVAAPPDGEAGNGGAGGASVWHSSSQCQSCHEQVHGEWKESWHAQSWIDPEVRLLSSDFANADCIDCHAPRPVFETGIGQRVLPRSVRRVEGVDCIACHVLPEGGVAGTRDVPGAACQPRARAELSSPDLCASCHDQHGTVQQWRASRYAQAGDGYQDCLDCHMPPRAGGGRDHRMHGGHDPALLRQAVALRGLREGERWVVEVENVGAGHNYPTDERSRASDVFWRPRGEERWRHLHRFRNPYRHEAELPNTELPAHATWRGAIEDEAAAGAIEVALFYKLSPYWSDPAAPDPEREATLVHRIELEPR